MADAIHRPSDDEYGIPNWSSVLFAGDLFADIPFGGAAIRSRRRSSGPRRALRKAVAYRYGLLISPSRDMVDQKTLTVAHPSRVLVPIFPFSMVAEGSPATA